MRTYEMRNALKTMALSLAMISGFTSTAMAGRDGGGGDQYTADYVYTAYNEAFEWVRSNQNQFTPPLDAEAFRKSIDPRRVASAPKVFESCDRSQSGREVAICYNATEDMFYISRALYPLDVKNSASKIRLIIHEQLRRLNREGDRYEITRDLKGNTASPLVSNEKCIRQMRSMGYSDEAQLSIFDANRICQNVVESELDCARDLRGQTFSNEEKPPLLQALRYCRGADQDPAYNLAPRVSLSPDIAAVAMVREVDGSVTVIGPYVKINGEFLPLGQEANSSRYFNGHESAYQLFPVFSKRTKYEGQVDLVCRALAQTPTVRDTTTVKNQSEAKLAVLMGNKATRSDGKDDLRIKSINCK